MLRGCTGRVSAPAPISAQIAPVSVENSSGSPTVCSPACGAEVGIAHPAQHHGIEQLPEQRALLGQRPVVHREVGTSVRSGGGAPVHPPLGREPAQQLGRNR